MGRFKWGQVLTLNSILRHAAFPWAASVLGALIAIAVVPVLIELPIYFTEATQLATGHLLPTTQPLSWPIGYSLILAPFVYLAGVDGVVAIQVVSYSATCWLFWKILVEVARANRRSVSPIVLGLGVALVAFHPYLLLDIKRVNESSFTPLLTLIIFRWILIEEVSHRFKDAILMGATIGLYVLMRPNAVTISMLPMIAALISRFRRPGAGWLAIYVVTFIIFYVSASLYATGQLFYWPSNGPYNLAAGNNPFAATELIHHQNGEPFLPAALALMGLPNVDPYLVAPMEYTKIGMSYLIDHPLQFFELIAIKIVVLFSPRLFNADTTFKVAMQSLLLYPVAAYLVTLLWRIRARTFSWPDWFMMGMVFLFTLPFALTNADPRLRMPLDLVMLGMALIWLDERLARTTKSF